MTTIKREDIKKGDRIRWTREATVVREERLCGRRLQPVIEVQDDDGRTFFLDPTRPQTLELLERPLPAEPAPGTVVVFRPRTGHTRHLTNGTAYQRFGPWWQSTRGPGRLSWADLLTFHPEADFERIEIGARS